MGLSRHVARAAPEPQEPSAKSTTGLIWEAKARQGLGCTAIAERIGGRKGKAGLGIFCYQLYYINAFGVALLPVRMNCCQKQGTKRGQGVRSNKTDSFSSTGRPRVPSLASEGWGARQSGCTDLPSATSPVSSLCRGEATCGLLKPQPSKPPGGLLLQGRREVPAPGD